MVDLILYKLYIISTGSEGAFFGVSQWEMMTMAFGAKRFTDLIAELKPRCVSKGYLTCAFFLMAEVHDLSSGLASGLASLLTQDCEPSNVIQMSCIIGLTSPIQGTSVYPPNIVLEAEKSRDPLQNEQRYFIDKVMFKKEKTH